MSQFPSISNEFELIMNDLAEIEVDLESILVIRVNFEQILINFK